MIFGEHLLVHLLHPNGNNEESQTPHVSFSSACLRHCIIFKFPGENKLPDFFASEDNLE